eukprot:IDg15796t1
MGALLNEAVAGDATAQKKVYAYVNAAIARYTAIKRKWRPSRSDCHSLEVGLALASSARILMGLERLQGLRIRLRWLARSPYRPDMWSRKCARWLPEYTASHTLLFLLSIVAQFSFLLLLCKQRQLLSPFCCVMARVYIYRSAVKARM